MGKKKPSRISGTKEWSTHSVNCIVGCSHDCRYCYAADMAGRFRRIRSREQWREMRVNEMEVYRRRRWVDGTIMFPSSHDITPETLEPCLVVLRALLNPGNRVLIVSKPHLSCMERICSALGHFRSQILFRFTIGARDDRILGYWEPGAPCYAERRAALAHCHAAGFATSVSCEPLLDAADAVGLFRDLAPFVTDSIWIGMMNQIRRRAAGADEAEIRRIEQGQTVEAVRAIYAALKHERLVRWKDSYKQALWLEMATEAGLDV